MTKADKTEAGKYIVQIDPYAEGFLPKKAPELPAEMYRDALDGFLSGNFEMVDSRAAEIIGSRGQSPKSSSTKSLSFSELAKAGVDFHDKKSEVRTASYSPTRVVEALDRHLTNSHHIGADAPKLAHSDGAKKTPKKPVRINAPQTTTFDKLHSGGRELLFNGHGEPQIRGPLFSLRTFIVAHHKR